MHAVPWTDPSASGTPEGTAPEIVLAEVLAPPGAETRIGVVLERQAEPDPIPAPPEPAGTRVVTLAEREALKDPNRAPLQVMDAKVEAKVAAISGRNQGVVWAALVIGALLLLAAFKFIGNTPLDDLNDYRAAHRPSSNGHRAARTP